VSDDSIDVREIETDLILGSRRSNMKMEKTVVGSFPRMGYGSIDALIEDTVDMQLKYDIDVLVDGEPRANMIDYFSQIPGMQIRNGGLEVVGRITPMDHPDEFVKLVDYRKVRSYLDGIGKKEKKVKVTLTGPLTLGIYSAIAGLSYYSGIGDERFYRDIAQALLPIAKKALDIGAYVQIDEPVLSTGVFDKGFSSDIVNELLFNIPPIYKEENKISLHMCGSVGKHGILENLMKLDVGVVSLGFCGEEEARNIGMITRKDFESNNKLLGAGFISNVNIEEVQAALQRLIRIEKAVGRENIAYLHPECGFGLTPMGNLHPILGNMMKASDVFMNSDNLKS
jgi:methionine synthase II (cobalamin-independent)